MKRFPFCISLSLCSLLLNIQGGYAHIILTSHATRHGQNAIKQGPCGQAGSVRSENVYVYEPGEVITLIWDEFIPHPGHFRIAFDAEGDDDFVDPADVDDFYTNETVLLDNLFPHTRAESQGSYTQEVTLPEVECENCTLQLVQMMTDKPPYAVGTNDLYYNCIDITLRRADIENHGMGGAEVDADAGSSTPDPSETGGMELDPMTAQRGGHSGCMGSSQELRLSGWFTFFLLVGYLIYRKRDDLSCQS